MPGELPSSIVESIAVANAKSVGEQPAILANLALANLINNTNLAQQTALANIQAANSVALAIASKSAETILNSKPGEGGDTGRLRDLLQIMEMVRGTGSETGKMFDLFRDFLEHSDRIPKRGADAQPKPAADPPPPPPG
jgi:hypothetical protein